VLIEIPQNHRETKHAFAPCRRHLPPLHRRCWRCPGQHRAALIGAAQAFPARPIRYICPWPAGGSTDAVIRALAESAAKTLGQQIIVDNKPGAGNTFGANELVNARPDGYTLRDFT